jgi:hypothetical protein
MCAHEEEEKEEEKEPMQIKMKVKKRAMTMTMRMKKEEERSFYAARQILLLSDEIEIGREDEYWREMTRPSQTILWTGSSSRLYEMQILILGLGSSVRDCFTFRDHENLVSVLQIHAFFISLLLVTVRTVPFLTEIYATYSESMVPRTLPVTRPMKDRIFLIQFQVTLK